MHINDLIKTYGKDLSNCNLEGVRLFGVDILEYALLSLSYTQESYEDIIYTDLENIQIPDDKELFQKILYKSLMYVNMPKKDYREYNFKDVVLKSTRFHKDSILPDDTELFQKIREKSLVNTVLPKGDFSKYNFKDVSLKGTILTPDTFAPNTKEFLQQINNKSIRKLKIYSGNYENWDFTGVDIYGAYFGKDVTLPKTEDLFTKVKNASINSCTFINKDLSNYDFTDVYMSYCIFKNCKFPEYNWVKKLRYKSLGKCEFENCDIGGAILDDSNIEGIKIDKCSDIQYNINIFQQIKNKNIENATLPIGDYSNHNFNGVKAAYSNFPLDATLPSQYSLFSDMKTCEYISLTKNVLNNIHLYDLSNIKLDLRPYKDFLTETQMYILRMKYKNKIERNELIIWGDNYAQKIYYYYFDNDFVWSYCW